MKIELWDKQSNLFNGHLDDIYRELEYCDVYFVADKGYAVLNHQPKYPLYKRLGIAEIQDLFVLPDCRGQGVATALISHCEQSVTHDMIGISVPVSPQFGAAQRLYAKLGYRPDGNGVTYDRQPIQHGASVMLDDDLCLMLIKEL